MNKYVYLTDAYDGDKIYCLKKDAEAICKTCGDCPIDPETGLGFDLADGCACLTAFTAICNTHKEIFYGQRGETMKVIKKNVYYCDFCGKKSLRSLKEHEEHCTANPDRTCQLCGRNESLRPIIEKYKKRFRLVDIEGEHLEDFTIEVEYLKNFTLEDIRNELEFNCPNCLLTIIRCLGLNRYYFYDKFKFDYQEELKEWWNAKYREDDRF